LIIFGGVVDDQTIVEPRPVLKDDNNNNDNGGDGKITNDDKGGNKNTRTILIAVIAVIVLCCCCLVIGVAGWYGYTTISSVESSPIEPRDQLIPQSDFGIGDPPSGGLGNDILRNDTWQVMASASVALGCDLPIASDTKIEVLQQPDSAGYWIEKWTVACQSGDTLAFEVEFITDDTGVTFNIKPLFE
jgi:hypothetical protein